MNLDGNHLLVIWSGCADLWWLIALTLVALSRKKPHRPRSSALRALTIFKPLPRFQAPSEQQALARALESFIGQLEPDTEIRFGIPREQAADWRPYFDAWRAKLPSARWTETVRPAPDQHRNPKVAWLEILASGANGEDWLWSDADISIPPGWLRSVRERFAASPARALTVPYCIRTLGAAPGMVDALFVHMEFLPGTLLMARLGHARLSFGSAVLFRSADFVERVQWAELGRCLADDFVLGQKLGPVEIYPDLVETAALESRLAGALRHLHRWQKTIRWCQPVSFAALILIQPLWGWGARCAFNPSDAQAWVGLLAQFSLEILVACGLSCLICPTLLRKGWPLVLAWPVLRAWSWFRAWLPLPAVWNDRSTPWQGPIATASTTNRPNAD